MPKYVCPECGREVVANADLEGHPADCARCGAHVESWPEPQRATRAPATLGGNLFQFAALAVFVVLALVILAAIFGRR